MGSGFSAMFEPFQSVAKSIGDGLKGIKLPDNPLKDVSLGNKGRNFIKGVSSGITGPKQVRVQVRTGPFEFGRATQMRSVSSTPMSVSGIAGDFLGDKISRMGRTGTKPIVSSNKPSFVERMKQKIKPTKTTNIGNIELSNMSQQPQPPQEIQQAGKKRNLLKKKQLFLKEKRNLPKKKQLLTKKKRIIPKKKRILPKKKRSLLKTKRSLNKTRI